MYTVTMNQTIVHSPKSSIYYAFFISIVLHVILLVFFSKSNDWILSRRDRSFLSDRMKQMSFEIIETPDKVAPQKPLQKTLLLSDKDNRVSDIYGKDNENGNLPFIKGHIQEKNLASHYMSIEKRKENPHENYLNYGENREMLEEESEKIAYKQSSYYGEFSKELLNNQSYTSSSSGDFNQLHYNQTEIDAQNRGGITFNTYKWDFAPYLLYLKERIQNNIYPPTSFTRLGFTGENIISFKIFPNGQLVNPNVHGFTGSEALVETSMKAVEMSAPFRPLPDNFPEEYLLVTAKFSYYLLSNN
ncbi:MAG: hypothetical protein P8078_11960 [bacterium]